MKLFPLAIVLAILAWIISLNIANAQGYYVYQDPNQAAFNNSYNAAVNGFNSANQAQSTAAQWEMVNSYREAHGLRRCGYGILGLLSGTTC